LLLGQTKRAYLRKYKDESFVIILVMSDMAVERAAFEENVQIHSARKDQVQGEILFNTDHLLQIEQTVQEEIE